MKNLMTLEPSEITTLVIFSLQNVLSDREEPLIEPLSAATCLIGRGAVLDSLGLVTLLVDLEQRLDEEYGLSFALADDRAMSQKSSPFRTTRSLADYICLLIDEARQNAAL
jgi:hypothetical protein